MELQALLDVQETQFLETLDLLESIIDDRVYHATLFQQERELLFQIPFQVGMMLIKDRKQVMTKIISRLQKKYFVAPSNDSTLYINWACDKGNKEAKSG